MEREQIRSKVKEIIANVAGLDRHAISDHATLGDDLGLDSLSRLEIGVDVDYAFKLKLPDESFKGIDGVDSMVDLVQRRLLEMAESVGVAGAA